MVFSTAPGCECCGPACDLVIWAPLGIQFRRGLVICMSPRPAEPPYDSCGPNWEVPPTLVLFYVGPDSGYHLWERPAGDGRHARLWMQESGLIQRIEIEINESFGVWEYEGGFAGGGSQNIRQTAGDCSFCVNPGPAGQYHVRVYRTEELPAPVSVEFAGFGGGNVDSGIEPYECSCATLYGLSMNHPLQTMFSDVQNPGTPPEQWINYLCGGILVPGPIDGWFGRFRSIVPWYAGCPPVPIEGNIIWPYPYVTSMRLDVASGTTPSAASVVAGIRSTSAIDGGQYWGFSVTLETVGDRDPRTAFSGPLPMTAYQPTIPPFGPPLEPCTVGTCTVSI